MQIDHILKLAEDCFLGFVDSVLFNLQAKVLTVQKLKEWDELQEMIEK